MAVSDPSRISSLDGWRAIAVAMVIINHAGAVASRSGSEFEASPCWNFGAGVDVFFAISGFLITLRILEEWESAGAVNLSSFYIRRTFRILPPALCVLLVTALLGLSGTTWNIISALTFWRNYLSARVSAWPTAHFWSLSLKEQFYLVWPCILALAGRNRAPRILFWSIMAVWVWRPFATLQWPTPLMMLRPDLRADGLLWGCLGAFAYRRIRIPGLVLIASLLAIMLMLSRYRWTVILPVALAAIVTATAQRPGSILSSALDWKPLAWIGRMSYSIYLWQMLFLTPSWVSPRMNISWPICLRIAVILTVACISYYFIEKPCIRFGKQLAIRLGSAKIAAPDAPGLMYRPSSV